MLHVDCTSYIWTLTWMYAILEMNRKIHSTHLHKIFKRKIIQNNNNHLFLALIHYFTTSLTIGNNEYNKRCRTVADPIENNTNFDIKKLKVLIVYFLSQKIV